MDDAAEDLHERLAQCSQDAARARAELDEFLYVVSHDLKRPLFGIETQCMFLAEDYGDRIDGEGRELIESVQNLAAELRRMIDAVNRCSHVGRVRVCTDRTDMNSLVREVLESLPAELQPPHVGVRLPHPLPPANCDSALAREVWRQLIVNAATFNDKREKWVEVGAGPSTSEGHPTYYVRDNGIGIAEKHQTAVFVLFNRLGEAAREPSGVGAGLTIAQRAVARHGGQISVESVVGEGSTFRFSLGQPQ